VWSGKKYNKKMREQGKAWPKWESVGISMKTVGRFTIVKEACELQKQTCMEGLAIKHKKEKRGEPGMISKGPGRKKRAGGGGDLREGLEGTRTGRGNSGEKRRGTVIMYFWVGLG